MRLTAKGRYAVTAMLHVALARKNGPVSAFEISQQQGVSLLYLEQLLAMLRHHRLVESVRGPRGGYRLAREPDQISVGDIMLAVNEPLDATRCQGKLNCQQGSRCMTHDLWAELNLQISRYLASVSLSQLAERERQSARMRQPLAEPAQTYAVLETPATRKPP